MHVAQIVISFIVILVSLTFHEMAHAATANALGDPTAKRLGRISVNPLVHIDPIGTVLLPLTLAIMGWGVFGWAKPVPVNLNNLRHPRRDDALISAAGPAANLCLAIVSSALIRLLPLHGDISDATTFLFIILVSLIRINILLMLFNLLPITPLDGSGVIQVFLSPKTLFNYQQISQKLMFVFLAILLMTDWIYTFYLRPFSNLFLSVLQYIAGITLVW